MRRTISLGVVFLCTFTWSASVGFGQESRKWTDASGQFSITGKFVSEKGGTVVIKNGDGEEMEIPLAKLSEADQKYVKGLADNPFRKKKANPFQPSMKRPTTGPKEIDWSEAQQVGMPLSSTEWVYEPDESDFETKPRKITLPGKTDFFEKATGFAGNPTAGRFVAGFHVRRPGVREGSGNGRIVLADVGSGRTVAKATFEGPSRKPIAIHNDGQQVVVQNGGDLEVWVAKGSKLEKVASFDPYPGSDDQIKTGWFLPNNQLATWNGDGKLAVWDFENTTPLYEIRTGNSGTPGISPGRNYIAFVTSSALGILDTRKGEIIASIPTPGKLNWPTLKFSPSGKKLACAAHMDLLIWDLTSGELVRNSKGPDGVVIHGRIAFPHDNFVLLGGQHLIELENRLRMWEYDGMGTTLAMGKYTAILVSAKSEGAILVGEIPHPPVFDELKKALTQPDLFVFRKGIDVNLDVSGVPANNRDRVQKALTSKLESMQCSVRPVADVTLIAKVSGPKQATRSYMHAGDHKVTVYSTSLQIMYQGKTAWQKSGSNIPFMLTLKRGENVAGRLAEYSKGPSYRFFDSLKLPEFVQKPAGNANGRQRSRQSIGASKVTTTGIR